MEKYIPTVFFIEMMVRHHLLESIELLEHAESSLKQKHFLLPLNGDDAERDLNSSAYDFLFDGSLHAEQAFKAWSYAQDEDIESAVWQLWDTIHPHCKSDWPTREECAKMLGASSYNAEEDQVIFRGKTWDFESFMNGLAHNYGG